MTKLNRKEVTLLFTLVHRVLDMMGEMDRQPRLDVLVNNLGEIGFTPHNDAGAAAVNAIQKWLGYDYFRIRPGDTVWIGVKPEQAQARYPLTNGGEQEPSSGDRSDPQRTGSAFSRSGTSSTEGPEPWQAQWDRPAPEGFIDQWVALEEENEERTAPP